MAVIMKSPKPHDRCRRLCLPCHLPLPGWPAGQLTRLNRVAPGAGDAPPSGLLDALALVPDPRDRRGVRYSLAAVLGVAVCATLWPGGRTRRSPGGPPMPRPGCGPGWACAGGAVPDLATIWRVLTSADPAALDAAIGAWVRSRLAATRKARRRVVLAVDGRRCAAPGAGWHRAAPDGLPGSRCRHGTRPGRCGRRAEAFHAGRVMRRVSATSTTIWATGRGSERNTTCCNTTNLWGRTRTEPALVVGAGQVRAVGFLGVVVEGVERLVGDLLRRAPGGVGLVVEDGDHGVAVLVAVQHRDVAASGVVGDAVPDGECDHGRFLPSPRPR